MPVQNINKLQNEIDFSYLQNLGDENIIQSLANLGQRIGLKGDGIEYGNFKFSDLFDKTIPESYKDDYIGYIKYSKIGKGTTTPVCILDIIPKSSIYDIVKNPTYSPEASSYRELNYNIFDKLNISTDIKFDDTISINNIELYLKHSKIKMDSESNELYTTLFGRIIGMQTNEDFNIEFMYNKFDLDTNMLSYGIRVYHLYTMNSYNYYVMLEVKLVDSEYYMDIHIYLDKSTTSSSLSFTNLFSLKWIKSYTGSDLTSLYINEDNLYDTSTLVGTILSSNQVITTSDIKLYFDDEDNIYYNTTTTLSKAVADMLSSYDTIQISERVEFLNKDIAYIYPKMLKYYCDNQYLANKKTLFNKIYTSLYEELISEIGQNEDSSSYSTLYIPLDYTLHYIVNDSNALKVYYSSNFYITLSKLSVYDDYEISDLFSMTKNMIFDYGTDDNDEKVRAYKFEINYNKKYNDYINYIVIDKLYTLPYINSGKNWSINDIDTQISALGKTIGNPNIVMLYQSVSNKTITTSFLNNSSNKDTLKSAEWVSKQIYIDGQQAISTYNSSIPVKCTCQIPTVTDNNFDDFKDTILFIISDNSALDASDYISSKQLSQTTSELVDIDYITSIWYISSSSENTSQFTVMVDPKSSNIDKVFNIASLFNLDSIIEQVKSSLSNTNVFKGLLIDTQINQILQTSDTSSASEYYYTYMKNKTSTELLDDIRKYIGLSSTVDVGEYNNDLNFVLGYAPKDKVTNKASGVTIEVNSEADKFYIDLDSLKLSNSLYYSLKEEKTTYTAELTGVGTSTITYIDNTQVSSVSNSSENSPTTGGDSSTTTSITGDEVSGYSYTYTYTYTGTAETVTVTKTIINKNEYTLDNDIPVTDYKEVLLRNVNVINRVNILSLGFEDTNKKKPIIYNSYIGSTFDDDDKSVLHIGSSSENINLGNDKLINKQQSKKLKKQTGLSIDFDYYKINATKQASTIKVLEKESKVLGTTVYSSSNQIVVPYIELTIDDKWSYKYNNKEDIVVNDSSVSDYKYFAFSSNIANIGSSMHFKNAKCYAICLNEFLDREYTIELSRLDNIYFNGSKVATISVSDISNYNITLGFGTGSLKYSISPINAFSIVSGTTTYYYIVVNDEYVRHIGNAISINKCFNISRAVVAGVNEIYIDTDKGMLPNTYFIPLEEE